MKKYILTAFALLMAVSMMTGCGCSNRNVSDQPGGMITDPTNIPATTNPMPTMTTPPEDTTRPTESHPATMPSRHTEPSMETEIPGVTGQTDSSAPSGATEATIPGGPRTRGSWPDRQS